ncbi:universal stress protein [Kiloniella laminariae]|uniref:universal stress protein n=1 Tax=Kiloniella laminariae TaxID=454162 RepID=UPI00037F24B0|nr:universal stress protein [Kiloniella laminariae]
MFEKILCAVDGSAHSMRAVEKAAALAVKFEGEIIFLTVAKAVKMNEGLRRFMEVEHISGQDAQYVLDSFSQEVLAEAKGIAKKAGVKKIKTEVKIGQPARSIVEYADGNKVDVIVMGSRGHGDLEALLLGSVSHKVASLSKVTCVTVR